MDELVRWLGVQLDEDERIARAATPGPWVDQGGYVTDVGPQVQVTDYGTQDGEPEEEKPQGRADSAHIAEHDPARVLREIDAKQRIIGAHKADPKGHCRACAHWTADWVDGHKVDRLSYEGVRSPCLTLRLLALPYSDRHG